MINESVFLYKNFDAPGFSILDSNMKLVRDDINYAHMTDVVFVICEKNKLIAKNTGHRNVHAWIEGTLIDMMPISLRLAEQQRSMTSRVGDRVIYSPFENKGFTLRYSDISLETAKEIVAYNGSLRVLE